MVLVITERHFGIVTSHAIVVIPVIVTIHESFICLSFSSFSYIIIVATTTTIVDAIIASIAIIIQRKSLLSANLNSIILLLGIITTNFISVIKSLITSIILSFSTFQLVNIPLIIKSSSLKLLYNSSESIYAIITSILTIANVKLIAFAIVVIIFQSIRTSHL